MNAGGLQVVEAVDYLDMCAPQPVELGDYQLITSRERSQAGLELLAVLIWHTGADLLAVGGGTPSSFERCQLCSQVLA